MSTDPVSIGEGLAFFRWHCLRWSRYSDCRGVNDHTAFCGEDWRDGNRG